MAGVKGRSGPKQEKPWRDAIMRAIKRTAGDGKTKRLDMLADALVAAGMDGDVTAIKEVGDRLDGKPSQHLEHTGADGGPIETKSVANDERAELDKLFAEHRAPTVSASDAPVVAKPH